MARIKNELLLPPCLMSPSHPGSSVSSRNIGLDSIANIRVSNNGEKGTKPKPPPGFYASYIKFLVNMPH